MPESLMIVGGVAKAGSSGGWSARWRWDSLG